MKVTAPALESKKSAKFAEEDMNPARKLKKASSLKDVTGWQKGDQPAVLPPLIIIISSVSLTVIINL